MGVLDLQKKSEIVGKLLLDKGVTTAPTMRVAFALDISDSMSSHIANGSLQKTFDQLMGVAMKFDDNGEADVFKFDTRCDYVDTSKPTEGDYDVFVKKHGIGPRGGTAYAPIVEAMRKFFFKKKGLFGGGAYADSTPVLALILTDGEPNDANETLRSMQKAMEVPMYFHLVGIGGERRNFPTIAWLADELDNVGEVYLPTFNMADEAIYQQLICDELVQWVRQFSGATV